MTPNRFSHVEDVLSESPDRSSPEFPDPNPPLKVQPITETTSVRSSLAAQESHHNNLFSQFGTLLVNFRILRCNAWP